VARYESVGTIVNRVLPAVGLDPVQDIFTGSKDSIQMSVLATVAGRELLVLFDWQILPTEYTITTAETDTGKYDLPADFDHLIDATGWSRDQRVPLPGSITPQTWQYLKGRNLVSSTIYMVFREVEGQFWVYPQPPDSNVPSPLTIAFEYMSRGFAIEADTVGEDPPTYADQFTKHGDVCRYDPLLLELLVKLRYKEAKGMDTAAAMQEWTLMLSQIMNRDVAAYPINAAQARRPYPYLDPYRNLPDTGYGQ
jgi:hypothetical protein